MLRFAAVVCFAACGCNRSDEVKELPGPPATSAVGAATRAPGEAAAPAPLKLWMTANLSRPAKTQDFEALGHALSVVAENAPPELAEWRAIAERGARAAADRDIDRVRASCGECHGAYRAEYRERFRARSFPQGEPR